MKHYTCTLHLKYLSNHIHLKANGFFFFAQSTQSEGNMSYNMYPRHAFSVVYLSLYVHSHLPSWSSSLNTMTQVVVTRWNTTLCIIPKVPDYLPSISEVLFEALHGVNNKN